MPWISFCISTYKRPELLSKQLTFISFQTFKDFEVVISDNDPDFSAKAVVEKFDNRFKYNANLTNLGMVESFNRSIKSSVGEYIIMITDDDFFTDKAKLDFFHDIYCKLPDKSIYINCLREGKKNGEIEYCDGNDFVYELLNPKITKAFLWSDCILKSNTVKAIGGMPNYGSPHLADHAMLALCAKDGGGVFVNNESLKINSHDTNFSKKNLDTYFLGCKGFYQLMSSQFSEVQLQKEINVLEIHLKNWAFKSLLTLKGYYMKNNMKDDLQRLELLGQDIFSLEFMKKYLPEFKIDSLLFYLKNLKKTVKYILSK
jgi:glycosyltransferase involved in cell wall biosynthesis